MSWVIHRTSPATRERWAGRLAVLLRRDGLTLTAIADGLNTHGYRTRRGQLFRKSTVYRLLPRVQ